MVSDSPRSFEMFLHASLVITAPPLLSYSFIVIGESRLTWYVIACFQHTVALLNNWIIDVMYYD